MESVSKSYLWYPRFEHRYNTFSIQGPGMPERYKMEIEEILEEAGELIGSEKSKGTRPSFFKLLGLQLVQSLGGKRLSLSPGRVMLLGLLLLLAALILRTLVPEAVGILAWVGLILLIVGYGMFFMRPKRLEKRWRGQTIDYEEKFWWDRFRHKKR